MGLNSLLGPMVADVIDYGLSKSLRNQLIGLDALSLSLVAMLDDVETEERRRSHPVSG